VNGHVRTGTIVTVIAAVLAAGLLTGCSRGSTLVVDLDGASDEETATLTPLERGELRREVLTAARTWVEAWRSSDADAMRTYATDDVVDLFSSVWDEYATRGQRVEHVHTERFLDVMDLSSDGTQALVTYRYDDDSYVVDAAGATVETLPALSGKEMQLTLQVDDGGTWRVVRLIAAADAYR
jgi:ketosteroid isomerase-like protein